MLLGEVGGITGADSIWGSGRIRFGEVRRGNDSLGKSNRSESVPENSRFRRGDSFEKSWGNESGSWALAFAGLLMCMGFQREGSRGGGIAAMGGWQGGGEGKRGWVPAFARTTGGGTVNLPRLHGGGLCAGSGDGDGSPHPRGQRREGRLIFPVFTGAGSAWGKRVSGG